MKLPALIGFVFACMVCNAQIISTVAGNGNQGYNGDNIAATMAELYEPNGIAIDSTGNLYIADVYNNRIRKVDAISGIISTVAGNGTFGYNGDGIPATAAELAWPNDLATDGSGNLYISDVQNDRIRKVNLISGIISTVAGIDTFGYNGDSIVATAAELAAPNGITFDASGNLYIADNGNNRIRKVDAISGIITTVAGNGTPGYNGDSILATEAELKSPTDVVIDGGGNLYIVDNDNNRIRKVDAILSIISTVAGNGVPGYSGDSIMAQGAELHNPTGEALDSNDNLYIADALNNRVRRIDAVSGIISTVAGDGISGYKGDGGIATAAELYHPAKLAIAVNGDLFISDDNNNRIRKVSKLFTGIEEVTAIQDELRIYPNPADKYVYCEMPIQGNFEFSLLNATGQLIATKQTPQIDIFDTEALPAGIYFIIATDRQTGVQTAQRVAVVH